MIVYDFNPNECPEWGGTYYPLIVCDACAQPITEHGNTYWLVHEDGEVHPQVWHTHKCYPCAQLDEAIRDTFGRPGSLVMSEELDRWLDQLRHNFAHLPVHVREGR